MNYVNIAIGDNLNIAGVQYEVQYISSCKDCCLCNTRQCVMLDPAISCGEKTHLGFKTIGYNLNQICNNNKNRNKCKSNIKQQLCKA